MKPNAKILIATDLGEAGDEAIATGDKWCRRHGGTLVVVHVMPERARDPIFPEVHRARATHDPAELERRIREHVVARMRELTGRAEGEYDLQLVEGAPAEGILDVAERIAADLVVLGGRAPGGKRWVFGSVAERVVTHAAVPVLVARRHAETARIVAATDLSVPSLPAVTAAHELARAAQSRVTIVHCIEAKDRLYSAIAPGAAVAQDETDAARAKLRELWPASEIDDEPRIVVGDAAESIVEVAEDIDAELIVVASRGKSALARLLLGSVASRVLRHADCSVLVVRTR